MFEVFLTDINSGDRVAFLITAGNHDEAFHLCRALQPFLREGTEAHFIRSDDYLDDEDEADRRYSAWLAAGSPEQEERS